MNDQDYKWEGTFVLEKDQKIERKKWSRPSLEPVVINTKLTIVLLSLDRRLNLSCDEILAWAISFFKELIMQVSE